MDTSEWERRGFLGINDGELQADLGGISLICRPPEVRLGEAQVFGRYVGDDHQYVYGPRVLPCVMYPLPKTGPQYLSKEAMGGDDGYIPTRIPELEQAGWKLTRDAVGVLNDFVKLAEGNDEKARRFVLKWGPLWYCQRHSECFWKITRAPYSIEPPCLWLPQEPLEEVRKQARRAKAVLDIAAQLLSINADGAKVEAALRQLTGGTQAVPWNDERNRRGTIWNLLRWVNQYLFLHRGPKLETYWDESRSRPRLRINSGWGFLPAVWLQLAQVVAGATGLYICDSCANSYIRHKRRPAVGKLNYCDDCENKGRKRGWARRNTVSKTPRVR